jgi:DNA gyrase subunit A
VLPTAVPNLLLNGTLGIAVGMATNIPPHNLSEVIDATTHLIDNPHATTEELCEYVKGPDFPLGGIAFGQADIRAAYASGRGGVVVRGEAEIVEAKNGSFQIIITSIPFRVLKSSLIENIAELVHEKKIDGIKGLRDESTKDIRVVIDLKSGAQPQKVLNYLYKHTELESTFHFNVVALVDGVPQTLALKAHLRHSSDTARKWCAGELSLISNVPLNASTSCLGLRKRWIILMRSSSAFALQRILRTRMRNCRRSSSSPKSKQLQFWK